MSMLRLAALLLLLGTAGLGAWVGAQAAVTEIERVVAVRIAAALDAMEMGWAEAHVDGLRVDLRGEAPDREAQVAALATVARAAPTLAVITERTTVRPPPQPVLPPPRVEMLRDRLGVTLTGRLPEAAMEEQLLAAFAAAAPGLALEPLIELRARRAPMALALAAEAVAAIPQAHALLEPGRLRLSGLVADEEERTARTEALLATAPEGLRIELDLRVPPPVIRPFAVALSLASGGAIRLETCAARTPEEAERILARLERAGLADGPRHCPVGLGGPPGDWPGAVSAGLDALALVPEGHLRVAQRLVRITLAEALGPEQLAEVQTALAIALPDDYAMQILERPAGTDPQTGVAGPVSGQSQAAVPDVAPLRPGIARRPWLTASLDNDGVALAGRLPDAAMVEALRALAAARFSGEVVSDALGDLEGEIPASDWQVAGLAAIEALALLREGRLELTDTRLELTGQIGEPALAGQIHRALAHGVPWVVLNTAFTVDLPAQVAAEPLTAERCLVRLNGHVALNPVPFSPGSADLDPAAEPVLNAVAALLRRCPGTAVEIGGHTDSQGSEGFNQRLSNARANAVRDALLLRGIRLARLAVRGYGESRPIATNRTEAGRERNRRIAFAPVEGVGQ